MAPEYRFCPDCGGALQSPSPPTIPPRGGGMAPDPRLRHLPEALAEKLRASPGAAGERKRATVLFCDLAGSTAIAENLDPEVFRDVLDRYLARAFEEISRYEGLVNQLAGDGLMALFGAPIAHEDEPERAVRAALAIQQALAGLSTELEDELGFPLEARIGIHTGTVVAGTVGNDLKMDYTAIGDTTNLAARLQGLARPGTVLISDATARLVEGRFELTSLPPFNVKGKTVAIVAHEVSGVAEAVSPMKIAEARGLTPLIGRSAELDQLEACFERLDRGLFQLVEVVGAAGTGKSRLLYEFRRRIEPQGPIVFEGRCSALLRSTPFGLWETTLRTFVGVGNADSPGEIIEKVERRIVEPGYVDPHHRPYLCRFLGVSNEAIAAEAGDITGKKVGDAYQSMLISAARKGKLVVLVEDLQWIDDASKAGMDAVLASIQEFGAMTVVTHRPDYEHDWQVHGAVTRLRPRPLSNDESREVVRAVARGAVPNALEERVLARAEGNPFFLEEVSRRLVEQGALAQENGHTLATRAIDEIEIPATIQEVLAARLDHLPPGAKRVAQVASVLGRQFESALLSALVAGEAIEIKAELAELERAGILHRKNTAGDEEYRFGESFAQEVAYDSLLLRERRRLHDLIGEQLQASDDRPVGTPNAQVGRHFARGTDPERGIRTLLHAGEQAEELPSYGDAIRLYREAWELAETALGEKGRSGGPLERWALRAALRLSNAAVFYGSAHVATDDRAALRGIELAHKLDDTDALARLQASYGMFVMNHGRERFGEGLDRIRKGHAVATNAGNDHAAATLMRALAFGYLLDGRFGDAEREIDATLAEFDRLGQRAERSDAYMGARFFRQRVLYESDRLAEAEAFGIETHRQAVGAQNRTLQSGSAAGIATTCLMAGRYEEAIEWANGAADLALEIESVAAARSAIATRVLARAALGHPAARPGDLDTLQRGLLTSSDLAINPDLMVDALVAIGEVERARKLATTALERAGGRLRQARQHLALAGALAAGHGGDVGQAHDGYMEAIAQAGEIGAHSILGRAHLGLARLARARGEIPRSVEHARNALALLEGCGFAHHAQQVRTLLADVVSAADVTPDSAGPAA